MADPLKELTSVGMAIWLDDLSRARLATGSLAGLVRDGHVVGVTSNPTIFQKAISNGDHYHPQIRDLAARGVAVEEALRMITTFDVRWACDVLRPVYEAGDGVDGWVSIEVDPRFAHDTEKTVAEARQLSSATATRHTSGASRRRSSSPPRASYGRHNETKTRDPAEAGHHISVVRDPEPRPQRFRRRRSAGSAEPYRSSPATGPRRRGRSSMGEGIADVLRPSG
jgi:hypothetical protein